MVEDEVSTDVFVIKVSILISWQTQYYNGPPVTEELPRIQL